MKQSKFLLQTYREAPRDADVISQQLMGTSEVLVIEHTQCGLHGAREADIRERAAHLTGESPDAVDIAFGAFPDLEANLRDQVDRLRTHRYLKHVPVHGLIYDVTVSEDGDAVVTMTLTTPNCPVAESMPAEVEMRVLSVPGIRDAEVKLVWDPPWDPAKMSDEARLELGML